ncbi:MAG TPA: hypothetical protein VFK13_07975 [Gemmatimonadaceae bacterium]|nr:hypothetical protein [Gemmatimonadaceae bacterium]
MRAQSRAAARRTRTAQSITPRGADLPWKFGPVTGLVRGDTVHLRHDTEGAELHVRGGRLERGTGFESASRAARQVLARAGAIQRLRSRGRYHVHAAGVVDPTGRAWLLAGDSCSGKSTLTYALARAGWGVLGDDGVVVERDGDAVRCHAWREPLHVSDALIDHFPELARWAHAADVADPRRRMPVTAHTARSASLAAIIFVRFAAHDAVHHLRPLDALAALVRQSRWVMVNDRHAAAHLRLLAHMVQSVPVRLLEHSPAQLHRVAHTLAEAVAEEPCLA